MLGQKGLNTSQSTYCNLGRALMCKRGCRIKILQLAGIQRQNANEMQIKFDTNIGDADEYVDFISCKSMSSGFFLL